MYIESKDRRLELRVVGLPADPQELQYVLTQTLLDYLPPAPTDDDYTAVIGTLERVKLEFYRRAVAVAANAAIITNGDIGYEDLPQNRGVS